MNEVISSGCWILVGVVVVFVAQTRVPGPDRRWLWISFWAHIISAFALILLTYHFFGRGDLEVYYHYGGALAEYIREDPLRWGPEVVGLIFQMEVELPIEVFGQEGSSTTSLHGITAIGFLLTGNSEFATGILMAMISFSGKWALYTTFRHHFGPEYRARVLVATLLVPSAVFWSSGVVKEAIAIGAMGWMIWGLHSLICERRRWRGLFWVLVGGVFVGIQKSYVLFPMAAGAGIWFFWQRSMERSGSVAIASRPLYMLGAGVAAVVGIVVMGELFPKYSLGAIAEEAAQLQATGERIQGGSSYALGDGTQTSLGGQLVFAPVAIIAALFRPFLFEAHNAVAAINAMETTLILVLWIWIWRSRGFRGAWRLMRTSPVLVFCGVFVVLFGLGVGLSTTNLGTLSRYRIPMMPLYAMILLMLLPMPLFKGGVRRWTGREQI